MKYEPEWLESLQGGSEPVGNVPAPVLAALKTRRRQRRARGVAGATIAVAVFGAATLLQWWPKPASPSPQVVVVSPEQAIQQLSQEWPESEIVSLASIYGAQAGGGADGVSGSQDRMFRIGDHWDPERVSAWVVD